MLGNNGGNGDSLVGRRAVGGCRSESLGCKPASRRQRVGKLQTAVELRRTPSSCDEPLSPTSLRYRVVPGCQATAGCRAAVHYRAIELSSYRAEVSYGEPLSRLYAAPRHRASSWRADALWQSAHVAEHCRPHGGHASRQRGRQTVQMTRRRPPICVSAHPEQLNSCRARAEAQVW